MSLPKWFVFSASNLQDYIECQRRFQLRYTDRLIWPAVEVEPYEDYERMRDQDIQFHKIIRQHLNGMSSEQISQSLAKSSQIEAWWENYLHSVKDGPLNVINDPQYKKYEGLTLSVPISENRLQVKYDLVASHPDGKLVIFDWITSTSRPDHNWFSERIKTHIYPFVLTRGISAITKSDSTDPEKIEMVYWFSNQPDNPERFLYNQQAYDADTQYLENLIQGIERQSDPIFPLTPDIRRCMFCNYRSFCDRGSKPGKLDQLEAWQEYDPASEDLNIEYDQIGETNF